MLFAPTDGVLKVDLGKSCLYYYYYCYY